MQFRREGVKYLRWQLGLTQRDLAKKLKVPQSSVHRWETGRTEPCAKNMVKLIKLAKKNKLEVRFVLLEDDGDNS